jgi:hypothetical protein
MNSMHPRIARIARSVRVSALLEKVAESHESESVREKAAENKISVDAAIFGMAHYTIDSTEKTAAAQNPIQHSANVMADLALDLYSFHKLAERKPIEATDVLKEAVEKMATVGAIEGLLSVVPMSASEDTLKLAAELRAMNRHYGARILGELSNPEYEKTAQRKQIYIKKKRKPGAVERAADRQRGGKGLAEVAERVQDQPQMPTQEKQAAEASTGAALGGKAGTGARLGGRPAPAVGPKQQGTTFELDYPLREMDLPSGKKEVWGPSGRAAVPTHPRQMGKFFSEMGRAAKPAAVPLKKKLTLGPFGE